MKNVKKVLGCLRKADNDFELIKDGDNIAVGISGGKDSSLLLYTLYLYQFFSKKDFKICGIYCDLGFGNDSINKLVDYFSKYNIQLYEVKTQIKEILDLNLSNDGKIQCSLCAKLRKGALINEAKRLGCNKVALGHHNDDAVETLFMNMINGGKVATLQPKVYLSNNDIYLIRPLIYSFEKDISKATRDLDIPIVKNKCSNDGNTERTKMKEFLHSIYHNYPQAASNFQLMLHNNTQFALFEPKNDDSETEDIEKKAY